MLKILGAAFGAALIARRGDVARRPPARSRARARPSRRRSTPSGRRTIRPRPGTSLNYQAIGSGGGIKQINASTVDFGASDKPLKPDDLAAGGLTMFPTVIGGVVPVMNLPGIKPGQIKLTGAILADIYRGAIKKWNDPLLAKINPGVALPNLPITVVHRSDGSGTTFLFTTYLQHEGRALGERGRRQRLGPMAGRPRRQGQRRRRRLREADARRDRLCRIRLRQAERDDLRPDAEQGRQVRRRRTPRTSPPPPPAPSGRPAPGFYLLLLDQPGADAWPITGATFILVHTKQADAAKGQEVLSFFDWCYKNGDAAAGQLDYVPLPAAVKDLIRKSWAKIVGPDGKPVYH